MEVLRNFNDLFFNFLFAGPRHVKKFEATK